MISTSTVIITVILAILTIALPRKYFLASYVLAACFVPADQRIIIMDLDFTCLRILIVAGALRIFVRGEQRVIKLNKFDKLLLAWALCGAAIYVLQWRDMRSVIYKCGALFDVIGMYWIFRQSIRSWVDIRLLLRTFAICAILLAPLVLMEKASGKNPFVLFGRVGTSVRLGDYRCQASFPHSIMLGLFWATLAPVFISLTKTRGHTRLYWLATGASIFIVCATVSSTPILTLMATLCFLFLFNYRRYGRKAAWTLCGLTVVLHIVMKAPVWHLISRIRFIGGSTGWHRYNLIDKAANHVGEWILLGCRSTAHWGWGLQDITNQYVLEAVRGGLITLILFVSLLIMAVKIVGKYSLENIPRNQQWLAWGICVSILGHCVAFMGVSYFGQITMLLYLTFALVGTICDMSCIVLPSVQVQQFKLLYHRAV